MCGRFAVDATPEEIVEHFGLMAPPDDGPRYNVAPTQKVTVIRSGPAGEPRADSMRWGLIPSGAADPAIGARMINARSETVSTKPSFRGPFLRQRCLVPATGFYEWRLVEGRRYPVYFSRVEGGLFAFAGLFDRWCGPDGVDIESCTILTTAPNPLVAPVHDRMPVMLQPEGYPVWLGPETPATELEGLFPPYPAKSLTSWPVSPAMNAPAHDGPACVARVAEPLPVELDLFS